MSAAGELQWSIIALSTYVFDKVTLDEENEYFLTVTLVKVDFFGTILALSNH